MLTALVLTALVAMFTALAAMVLTDKVHRFGVLVGRRGMTLRGFLLFLVALLSLLVVL
jgi:hypothetical protein